MAESSKPMHVADRMSELVEILQTQGVNEIKFVDVQAECKESWSADYAIVCDAYSPDLFMLDAGAEHYFDHSQLVHDFKEFVKAHFAADPTVEVHFHNLEHGSNEIEVYRKTEDKP